MEIMGLIMAYVLMWHTVPVSAGSMLCHIIYVFSGHAFLDTLLTSSLLIFWDMYCSLMHLQRAILWRDHGQHQAELQADVSRLRADVSSTTPDEGCITERNWSLLGFSACHVHVIA